MKSITNFRGQAWVRPPGKCWPKGFILPHKYHALISTKDSSVLKIEKLTIISRGMI